MGKRFFILALSLWLISAGRPVPEASKRPVGLPSQSAATASQYRTVVNQYCVTCHNESQKTGGLTLETMDFNNIGAGAEVWEKVVKKLRSGMMPPQGRPKPDDTTRNNLASWLETSLDRAAAQKPDPGRPLLRRLNRAEYANAIRDLLAVEVDPATLLPPDDSGYGFDNNADILGISPVLLERYLSAAGQIGSLAVGDPDIRPGSQTIRIRQDASQDRHIEGLPLGTVGGALARVNLPLDGEYAITVRYFRTNLGAMRGLEYPHQVEITVDGDRVHLGKFGGDADFKWALENITLAADDAERRSAARVNLKAGPREIGVAFLDMPGENTIRLQPFIRSSNDTLDPSGHAHIDSFAVTGPFNASGPGDTPSRRRIFVCRPNNAADEEPCARRIVTTLAHRAYRGFEKPADIERLMSFYKAEREGKDFERGVQMALQRLLSSPKFIFRTETDPAGIAPGAVHPVSGLEMASRLSFFLWSSIPDDELLNAAVQGKLKSAATLDQQIRRMLADPKAQALVQNFAGQWLYLRNLKNQIPNSLEFPDFDDNLRQALQRETELFFNSIIQEDRNVLDLMTADYTFVNERLAKHYDIPNVYGSQFRRVAVTDEARKGLLGQGSILMVTSHTDRTSPVVRGKWILENLLGSPPPPPPAMVPPLKESAEREGGKILSMRERMEEHRNNPACSGCHSIMDPIGFAMENFDAVGAWRTHEARIPIDASGQLLDGTKVSGVVELKKALMRQPERFVETFTEKLMTYALGRGLAYYDMPAVRAVVRDSAHSGYKFSSIVSEIVQSTPFQMRVKASESSN
jgi:mono/diheme cytochrome c family protein